MKRAHRVACLVGFALTSVIVAIAACSNQEEGARCDFDNGNDDCLDGLVCTPKGGTSRPSPNGVVNPPFNNSDRCCPLDRSTATHPACTLAAPTGTSDAAPTDASPTDAAADAPAEAADADADAPEDAPDAD